MGFFRGSIQGIISTIRNKSNNPVEKDTSPTSETIGSLSKDIQGK